MTGIEYNITPLTIGGGLLIGAGIFLEDERRR
jgi:hypothetical protein